MILGWATVKAGNAFCGQGRAWPTQRTKESSTVQTGNKYLCNHWFTCIRDFPSPKWGDQPVAQETRTAQHRPALQQAPYEDVMAVSTSPAVAKNFNWTALSPHEHLVQLYARDADLLDSLEDYVRNGIEKGEVVVLVVTPEHLDALDQRLAARGFDLDGARAHQLYLTFDASETLQKFMVRDWPDEALFQHFIHRIVTRANGRRIRAFGEMVALLLARGQTDAMLRLEQLWQPACEKHAFMLFCAYPRNAFADMDGSIRSVCAAHSCVIS
jgi:hypothetical protein